MNETHEFVESVFKGYTEVEALKNSAHTLKEEVLDSLLLTCCILKSKKDLNEAKVFAILDDKVVKGQQNSEPVDILKKVIEKTLKNDLIDFAKSFIQIVNGKDTLWVNGFLCTTKDFVLNQIGEEKGHLVQLKKRGDAFVTERECKKREEEFDSRFALLNVINKFEFYFKTQNTNFKCLQLENKNTANSCFGFLGTGGTITSGGRTNKYQTFGTM